MIEYYNKIYTGFEFCKKNLESDMTYEQFISVNKLVSQFVDLTQHYLNQLKKQKGSKHNHKYLLDKSQEWVNTLSNMVITWSNQYEKMQDEEEAEEKKRKDIWNQLMIQEEFQKQKDKAVKKTTKKIGFVTSKPKKSRKKKTNVEGS